MAPHPSPLPSQGRGSLFGGYGFFFSGTRLPSPSGLRTPSSGLTASGSPTSTFSFPGGTPYFASATFTPDGPSAADTDEGTFSASPDFAPFDTNCPARL